MARRYAFERSYGELFRNNGVDLTELLRRSALPEDLFGRRSILLTRDEYWRLMNEMERQSTDEATFHLATHEGIENLSPPAFAAYCSKDGMAFLQRFAAYKQMVAPMHIVINEIGNSVQVNLVSDEELSSLPHYLVKLTMLFIVAVLRRATKSNVCPLKAETRNDNWGNTTRTYLGCELKPAAQDCLVFDIQQLQLPFVGRNEAMWHYLEPELNRRLMEMNIDDTTAARVRSALVELLPAGNASVESVAQKLFVSRRTLQRKLADEHTTFQQQLNSTRLLLAKNYIKNENRRSEEIAFLLGYEDVASFLRAFNAWTGMTVTEYRNNAE